MKFFNELKRIRRYLRDPDGNIWSRAVILNLFNDCQRDIQMKTKYLMDAQNVRIPPFYQYSYMQDWEWAYLPATQNKFYQCLRYHQQGDFVFCHRWEGQLDYSGDAVDGGAIFTHPWEAWAGLIPSRTVAVTFPQNFHEAVFVTYNRDPIEYIEKKKITSCDSSYISHEGTPIGYYREDTLGNDFIPYPKPSTIVWNDVVELPPSPDFVYTHDWESTYLSGNGEQFTTNDPDEERDYIYTWETGTFSGRDEVFHGMYLFETEIVPGSVVSFVETDALDSEVGDYATRTGSLFNQDSGVTVDIVDLDDNILLVYKLIPTDIVNDDDESDFPSFLQKYIEYGALERAYQVNNDGNIASLSQYWGTRYELGLAAIKRFMNNRLEDRDFRLTTKSVPAQRSRRHARLPSTYPAV
jgi:hypothetical protein